MLICFLYRLGKTRRKRAVPADWATAETIQSFGSPRPSEPLYPGGKSISLDKTGELALVGGTDGVAGVFSIAENSLVQPLKVGSPITDGLLWDGKAVVSTASGTVKVLDTRGAEVSSSTSHAGAVSAIALHPSGDILASVGVDKSLVFYDLAELKAVAQVYTDTGKHSRRSSV
jgi:pre-mRNA-processing factor 19